MKQVKLMIPVTLGAHFAKWSFENAVRVLLSYSTDDFWGNAQICVFVALEEEKLPLLNEQFKAYIKL